MPVLPDRFLNVPPASAAYDRARCVILPVPYEGTVSFMPGTANGPAAILRASAAVEEFDEEFRQDFSGCGLHTCPPVVAAATPEEQVTRVKETARPLFADGKFVLALGGEHSITPGLVAAAALRYPELSVLQIDAHADLRDTYGGTRYSHACAMRRVLEITPHLTQVGIRSFSKGEQDQCPDRIEVCITVEQVRHDPQWLNRVLARLTPWVYVTVDLDGFDPAYVPGTGTPEPGGLDWHQVTRLLRQVGARRQIIGGDIVELAPIPGSVVSEFLAARLAYKLIAYSLTEFYPPETAYHAKSTAPL